MDEIIELSLAKQVLGTIGTKNNFVFSFSNKEIVAKKSITCYDTIKTIMEYGVSPLTIIQHNDETNTLIHHVFRNTSDYQIIKGFINLLTSQHIDQLSTRDIYKLHNSLRIMETSESESEFLQKIFTLGFDFEQGMFGEAQKALEGNLKFFELCLEHKHDFKWDLKYHDDKYLDELLNEKIENEKSSGSIYDIEQKQNLLVFLQQTRKVQTLKNNLEKELTASTTTIKKNKI